METVHPKLSAKGVNAVFARKAQAVLDDVSGHGYKIKPSQVLRSISAQRSLFAQGRKDSTLRKYGFKVNEISAIRRAGFTAEKSVVTKVLNSKHTQGLAMDIAFFDAEGNAIWSTSYAGWAIYGKACRAHNLIWGGDWKSFRDLPHCELKSEDL